MSKSNSIAESRFLIWLQFFGTSSTYFVHFIIKIIKIRKVIIGIFFLCSYLDSAAKRDEEVELIAPADPPGHLLGGRGGGGPRDQGDRRRLHHIVHPHTLHSQQMSVSVIQYRYWGSGYKLEPHRSK